jgi:hypothetical protein
MSKIMSSIPGMSGAMEGMSDEDTGAKLKRMIYIMDSMRADELDSDGLIFVSIGQARKATRWMDTDRPNGSTDATGQGRSAVCHEQPSSTSGSREWNQRQGGRGASDAGAGNARDRQDGRWNGQRKQAGLVVC